MISKKEVWIFIGASVFLGFSMAVHFKWPLVSFEPFEWLWFSFLCAVSLFIFITAQKIIAYTCDSVTELKLLSFKRFGFESHHTMKKPFPIWLVLPIIVIFITNKFRWLGIADFNIKPKRKRIRRKFQEMSEGDIAKVAIAGPIASMILTVIMFAANFREFALINAWIALLALLPIGNGAKVFFGSRVTWVFVFIISILVLLLFNIKSVIAIIILSVLIAIAILIAYYVIWERNE